jgi:hypothetical protein
MATKPAAQQTPDIPQIIKARVLQDCRFGKCNSIAEVSDVTGLDDLLDADPSAVAYAESVLAESL